jgi:hypothetical protein
MLDFEPQLVGRRLSSQLNPMAHRQLVDGMRVRRPYAPGRGCGQNVLPSRTDEIEPNSFVLSAQQSYKVCASGKLVQVGLIHHDDHGSTVLEDLNLFEFGMPTLAFTTDT